MENRNTKEAIQKDIDFLNEIKQNSIKWKEGNDYAARDMLFTLINDWINELSVGNQIDSKNDNCTIFNVCCSLPTVNDIRSKAKEYFDSLCINQKSYLYPTKGFIEGAMWMRELIKSNER